jgi:hypothetical protein
LLLHLIQQVSNVANGLYALEANTTGGSNVVGANALDLIQQLLRIAVGNSALGANTKVQVSALGSVL